MPQKKHTPSVEQAKVAAFILESELSASVTVFDGETGVKLVAALNEPILEDVDIVASAGLKRPRICANGNQGWQAVLPLRFGPMTLVAVARVKRLAPEGPVADEEQRRLEKWCGLLVEKLTASHERGNEATAREREAGSVIAAMDVLLRTGRLTGDRAVFQRHVLKAICSVLGVRAATWIPMDPSASVVTRGIANLSNWDWRQVVASLVPRISDDRLGLLIDNVVPRGLLANRLPDLRNIMVMRVQEEGAAGYLIAFDRVARAEKGRSDLDAPLDFRRGDAALMAPFATLLGAQARASSRHDEMKELVVGLTRSLTSAIDAKDPYTFGHSERVARIAVELAREMGLGAEAQSDIYLVGLLHDIGKIGVRDSVLGKNGPLTDEERDHINQHPRIGYRILLGIGAIKHLLGGVLYHHEQFNGAGYPDGLAGEKIPQIARIIAVADSFDAMRSDRPYRPGMPLGRVESILSGGSGTQWDPEVIDAYERCKQKVSEIREQGVGESLRLALDGAMRHAPHIDQSISFSAHRVPV